MLYTLREFDPDEAHGFHIQTVRSRREWDKANMLPTSEASLLHHIKRAPTVEDARAPRSEAMRARLWGS